MAASGGDWSRAVVTGGRGFVGAALVRELVRLGTQVVVLDRGRREPTPPGGARHVQVDIRDAGAVARAIADADADVVFHLAANASGTFSIAQPHVDFEINALGTVNVAEAVLAAGVPRLVLVSSASVYGPPRQVPVTEEAPTAPILPYGASKLSGEMVCRAMHASHDLPVVVARPFCIYGPGEDPVRAEVEVSRFLRWHLHERPIRVLGDPDGKRRDFVSVHDVAAALIALAERGTAGDVMNVGSGTDVSLRELLELIGAATGRDPEVVQIEADSPDSFPLVADTSRLRSLGWEPRVSLESGIAELVPLLRADPRLPVVDSTLRADQLRSEPPDFEWAG
jgi:nucleoside-diphosphate-sugar epimerase